MDRWVSEELSRALAELTSQQSDGITSIVKAELDGASVSSLLKGPNKICAWKTYHGSGKRKGWKHKPEFQRALKLARRDYRTWMLQHGVEDAMTILTSTAPGAAQGLRQRVYGDDQAVAALVASLESDEVNERALAAELLGKTGFSWVAPALQDALDCEEEQKVRVAILRALGRISIGEGRDTDSFKDVLNRADIKTAAKGTQALTGGSGGPIEVADRSGVLGVVADLDDEGLEQFLANLEVAERAASGE